MPDLSSILFNQTLLCNNTFNLAFVYGSGRHRSSIGQVGLICDALHVPEITTALSRQNLDVEVNIKSYLDIDVIKILEENGENEGWSDRPHFILCGTGDINYLTGLVIEHYRKENLTLKPGFARRSSANIIGYKGTNVYSASVLPDGACLLAARNPWWPDRLVIVCGGIFGTGTIGAMWLLHQYISGKGRAYGNNKFNPSVPGKIISVQPREYHDVPMHRVQELTPRQDIRNVNCREIPIEVIE